MGICILPECGNNQECEEWNQETPICELGNCVECVNQQECMSYGEEWECFEGHCYEEYYICYRGNCELPELPAILLQENVKNPKNN
jgi:hypothetical protein